MTDALNIIKGPKDAATNYFKEKTTEKLIVAFTPSIKSSLDKTDATKYYGNLVNTYNVFPLTIKKVNPDLIGYVTGKAVDALFDQVAKEEANIRANPLARTTDILKKVFGGLIKIISYAYQSGIKLRLLAWSFYCFINLFSKSLKEHICKQNCFSEFAVLFHF